MKFRIITGILLVGILLFIYAAFSGEEDTSAPPASQEEQGSGYGGLGK